MLKPGSRVMAEKKAVLFNFWGVVVPSKPDGVFQKVEERHSLPGGSLSSIYSQTDGSLRRAERGDMPLSEMLPALEAECVKESQAKGAALPSDWSINGVLKEIRKEMMNVRHAVLKTAASLRRSGVLTAVLANHWLDDVSDDDTSARLLCLLGGHFDLVLQSCHVGHRVPEPDMFSAGLQQLRVTPQNALWVDAGEAGVKAAEAAGMKAVLMESLDAALEKISEFTGVKAEEAESPPPFCGPDEVCHGYVTIRTGVRTHFVEMGCGPPVLLCHGFPESWYSWRFQIPALAAAGFRVLALDMKGYGESTAPPDIEEFSQEQLCKDLITFLDKMAIPQVTLVGHDWGGALVWSMAQFHPERVRAVASLNTPLFKVDPSVPSSEKLKDIPIFDYQLYFQTPGVAEAELEKNLERTFKIFFSRSSERSSRPALSTAGVRARGGLFVGLPEEIPQSSMLTQSVLQYYVSQFEKSGFRGPLNWYRNGHANWKWSCSQPTGKLLMPALMVTAGKDFVLLPALSKGMEDMIPNLTRGHIEECGHWTQMDKPAETNDILIGWLKEVHQRAAGVAPKL
ncbi:bifunctional epoxide hydrolase 2 [Oryzias melastigma]|uniref:Epoxide hydrolase 2 n=1 Tax=Oryzias melastigma TaxID=30732 RepID=A0A3B3DPZ7_ORYME|nr:bifunctional epoxide hydrolase 2 [Oryzias melastigma]